MVEHDDVRRLRERVAELAAPTPYVVRPAAGGFDVLLDLGDEERRGAVRAGRLRSVSGHEVRVDPERRVVRITDVVWSVAWQAGADGGAPVLRGRAGGSRGAFYHLSFAEGPDGKRRLTATSSGARGLVRDAAAELGWAEKDPASVRVAKVVGVIGAASLVLVPVALLVVLATGGFS